MRNTITLNGTASTTIAGLLIQSLPPITKPQQRTTIEEIDGRDGDIVTELGFAAYDKEITIGLYGTFDINQVIAYFNSEGTVTFSNEPDKLYNYKIINKIDFERLVRYRTATVTFHCQPFKYPTTGTSQTLDGSTVTGEGSDFYMPNTTEGVFAKFTPEGNTEQQTYTGKNLFNKDATPNQKYKVDYEATDTGARVISTDSTGYSYANFFYDMEGHVGQTLTLSATATASASNRSQITIGICNSTGGSRVPKSTKYGTGAISVSYTLQEGDQYIYINFYANGGGTAVADDYSDYENVQLEFSSTVTSYEPYVGGAASPNPDYPQNINVVTGGQDVIVHNKNLFKIPDTENTTNNITYTPHPDGTFDLVGTASASAEFYTVVPLAQSGIEGGATYKPSTNSSIGISSVRYYIHSCNKNAGWVKTLLDINKTTAQTAADPTTEYVKFVIRVNSGNTVNLRNVKFQLERGNTETAFQPYQSQNYEINLGKNLFDSSQTPITTNGATAEVISTGLRIKATSTGGNTFCAYKLFKSSEILGQTITLSATTTPSSQNNQNAYIGLCDENGGNRVSKVNFSSGAGEKTASYTHTTEDASRPYIIIALYSNANSAPVQVGDYVDYTNLQLEFGDTATTYTPYITPIELCKIGDYQDYFYKDGDDWYLHKEIGKSTLGDLTWGHGGTNQSGVYRKYTESLNTTILPSAINVAFNGLCTHFKAVRSDSAGTYGANTGISVGPTGTIHIYYSVYNGNTSADNTNFKTWLQDNNVVLYYALATPTNTKITNTALIAQLNAMAGASAYKGGTYVTSTTTAPNLPITIHAEMAGDMDATITNAGNIYSRPKLTITGSGDIGVYLNGSQMFQIELGDEGSITIDTDTQEAYKGTTATLKNRLVTGDYSKFKLNPGANQLAFTGNATQCVVENYTRWL